MNNILVPIGTSPNSSDTLQYVIDFASNFGAKVFVMDVFTVTSGTGSLANVKDKVVKSSKEQLKEIIDTVDTKNVEIKLTTYNGDIIDGLKEIDKKLGIDLILIAPRSNAIEDELYLGTTTGRIVKKTNIPTLIIPKGTTFKPIQNIMTAFGSGIVKRSRTLNPLIEIKDKFRASINLLLVKRPGYSEEDLQVNTSLLDLSEHLTITSNPTTYLGVLEYYQAQQPDMLCVFRRKRGFFKKLWEKNTIPKSEFFVPIPVLILSVKK
ncbi:universal stress protein [Flagellimonas sp. HMM57]|uniref:universal stress protein n=1 Tax=unclassified Flagellimonas TaxID=2644544 RepID=UPI0013D6EB28|nr:MULTISPECIES: universal stress protein [unclassified Flagellimonas]UII77750.1 universal stress protein [Flagellimonas sp. HMM57]